MTRIVIVDDRKTNLRILRQMTQGFEPGAAIETFGHVEAAMDWRALYAADVVVTAFDMTKSNGAEFTRWLRAEVQDSTGRSWRSRPMRTPASAMPR